MKNLFFLCALVLLTATANAQIVGKVTKITAASSPTGTIVLEDTTAGATEYIALRRGEVLTKLSGAGSTARIAFYSKYTQKQIWTGLLSAVYVLSAGGNPSTQTASQKLTYLKANTY